MIFELSNLSYAFPGQESPVLKSISCSIERGKTIAVVGLSGSGKSTLLNILGLLFDGKGHSGSVRYLPESGETVDYQNLTNQQATRLRSNDFGFVLQSAYMLSHFQCLDNVGMPLSISLESEGNAQERAKRLLDAADPSGKLSKLGANLARNVSGGEKQRMAVLRAIIHDPSVVFADEPLSNLDPKNSDQFMKLILDWKAGKFSQSATKSDRTLILVTHDLALAWEHADQFLVLRDGEIVSGDVMQRDQVNGPEDLRSKMYDTTVGTDDQAGEQFEIADTKALSEKTSRTSGSFLRWFARQNLWEHHARPSTWINIISIAVVVAFVLITYGLTTGVENARKKQLGADPLNLCLWLESGGIGIDLTPDVVGRIGEEVQQGPCQGKVKNVAALYSVDLKFFRKDEPNGPRVTGRTVESSDPIMQSLKGAGVDYVDEETPGLFITKGLLVELGFDPEMPPGTLTVELKNLRTEEIKVLGVLENLPLFHRFVISTKQFYELVSRNPNPRFDKASVAPIPDDWPEPHDFSDRLKELVSNVGLNRPTKFRNSWDLRSRQPISQSEWISIVRKIDAQLQNEGKSSGGDLDKSIKPPVGSENLPVKIPEFYSYVGIYCHDVDGLTPAGEICEEMNIVYDKDIIARLQSLGAQTKAVLVVMSVIGVAIALVVLFNMAMTQVLRNEQRKSEIGMLKAMGMPGSQLLGLAWVESRILWFWGTVIGILVAVVLGNLFAQALSYSGVTCEFSWPWTVMIVTALVSFLICLMSNLFATRTSRQAAAAESLRHG